MSRQKPEDIPLAASEHSLIPAVGVQTLPMLKIADFGFARHLPAQSLAETLCGSPLYMAPEILSYKKYDAKADLWSVGTVTYEMLVGKPPFKAANHVDLMRKIDQAEDIIPFPKTFSLSSDLKQLIESLLKRDPSNRVEFENFFASSPVLGPIPGLVEEDIVVDLDDDTSTSDFRRLRQIQITERPSSKTINHQDASGRSPVAESRGRSSTDQPPGRNNAADQADLQERPSPDVRPSIQAHATAPAREFLTLDKQAPHSAPMVRQHSATATSATSRQVVATEKTESRSRKDRDSAAQDLAFEKEYVMIEKRAVEVNAFADELAAAPHGYNRQPSTSGAGAIVRRATNTTASSSSPPNAGQLSSGRRADVTTVRQPSYERRYAPSPTSATNMLSKALNMANARLYGMLGGSPPMGTGISPPRGYGAYPSYPSPAVGLAITDGKEQSLSDEDFKVLRTIEEAATRSDTVYSFAEVKFRQILPATPSADDVTGPRSLITADASLERSNTSTASDLTHVAIISVSEEALVLFVKALAILAKSIHLAGSWWASQKRVGDDYRPTNPEVCKRMNSVVQWARNRFNECLEKSEIVGRRLIEAQQGLPSTQSETHKGKSAGSNVGTLSEPIRLTSGITAEKLMFERAVEMSRQAAINELIDEDFRGCEIAYRTAIMLMEAVLEEDDEPLQPRPSSNKDKSADEAIVGMESEDRRTIVGCKSSLAASTTGTNLSKVIDGTRLRLRALCKKIQAREAAVRRPPSDTGVLPHAR